MLVKAMAKEGSHLPTQMDTSSPSRPSRVAGLADDPIEDLRSPEPKARRGEEPSLRDVLAAVTSGFSGLQGRLDGIEYVQKEQGSRLEAVEKRCEDLEAFRRREDGRRSSPSRASSSGEETTGILGGFKRDTRKKVIEDFLDRHFPELREMGAFAPGPRTSIAIVRFRSKEELRSWMPKVSAKSDASPTGKMWLAPSRPPEQRARRREVYAIANAIRPHAEAAEMMMDTHPSHGIIWVQDERVAEYKETSKQWTFHEDIIRRLFNSTADIIISAAKEAV